MRQNEEFDSLFKVEMIDISEKTKRAKALVNATHWGIVYPVIRDGVLTGVVPFELDRHPSENLRRLSELPYCASRIRTPAVREGFLADGISSRENRGKDRWIPLSWDEALDLAAQEIMRVYRDYGPNAVFGQSYGWKSPGAVNSASTLQRRLLKLCGGYVAGVNSYSTAAISTILPYVLGSSDPRSTDWKSVLDHAERVVFWGADPLVTNDIDWSTTLHNSYPNFEKLKDSSIRRIDVNPIRTKTGEFLDSEWIAPKPGSDCALMLAIMYTLEKEGLTDTDFIGRCTEGFEIFRDYLFGSSDQTPKTPEWAEPITGVSAEKIRMLARDWSSHRTMIMMGWGVQRIQYGEQAPWMACTLASMLGSIGKPGGGIGLNYHYCSGGCPPGYGPSLPTVTGPTAPVLPFKNDGNANAYIPVMRFVDCLLHPGKTIEHNGRTLTYPDIKLIMWTGGNPFSHQPQTLRLEQAWKKPEFVCVTDCFWTATARQADLVLPAQTVFEHDDIAYIGSYTNDGIVANKRCIEPLYESKSDFWIYSELAGRLGCEQAFTLGLTEAQWIRRIYDSAAREAEELGLRFPRFDDFWNQGILLFPTPNVRPYVAFEDFRFDPKANPLKTESGKIQIFSHLIDSYGYRDCLGHPAYFEPAESLNTKDLDGRLALVCGKSAERLHSQTDGTQTAEKENLKGREPIWIHPKDAASRGIRNGDIVLVSNERGSLLAAAHLTENVREDVVAIRHGAWFDPQESASGNTLDAHGNANTLTMDEPTSKLACGNIASTCLVRIEKFTGVVPKVKVREQPNFVERKRPESTTLSG